MDEAEIREFLARELAKTASTTSFYWESEELEEVLDVIVDAVARLIAANNKALTDDIRRKLLNDARLL